MPVEVADVRLAKTTADIRAVGSLLSDEAVQIAPEVSGRIASIAFSEGEAVNQGDIVVKLDDSLAQAEVADAKARLTLSTNNNNRASALIRSGTVTARTRDEAVASFETGRTALALAETRVSKLTLRAPFNGYAGVRRVSAGAFVSAGTAIVNIEKIDVLKVAFKVPEIYLLAVQNGQSIELQVDAIPGRSFEGKIYAIDPLVDVNGRALEVRARVVNKDMVLRPGLFARVTVKGLVQQNVLMVPESALVPRGSESYVYRIANGKAAEQLVKLGQRLNGEVEILEGLDDKAAIVVAGQLKLRNGDAVEVIPSTAPARAPDAEPLGDASRVTVPGRSG